MSIGHFLGGIGACIYDPHKKKYLILRRADQRDFGANQWECLTGRVNQGESFTQALHREVQEEIGVQVNIEFIIGTTHFYRGENNPNNELLGVIYACAIPSQQKLSLGEEHSEYRWVSAGEVYALLPKDNWLSNVIRKAEMIRLLIPRKLLDFYQKDGFDI
jgi:8-oxo-dGTP diphosphatase